MRRTDIQIAPFIDTRVEIREATGEVLGSGWLHSDSDPLLILEVAKDVALDQNQAVELFLSNSRQSLLGRTRFWRQDGNRLVFSAPTELIVGPGSAHGRRRGISVAILVDSEEGAYIARLIDLSVEGISLIAMDEHTVDTVLTVEVETDGVRMPIKFRVTSCVMDPWTGDHWRIGGPILDMSRVDRVRWKQLIESGNP